MRTNTVCHRTLQCYWIDIGWFIHYASSALHTSYIIPFTCSSLSPGPATYHTYAPCFLLIPRWFIDVHTPNFAPSFCSTSLMFTPTRSEFSPQVVLRFLVCFLSFSCPACLVVLSFCYCFCFACGYLLVTWHSPVLMFNCLYIPLHHSPFRPRCYLLLC